MLAAILWIGGLLVCARVDAITWDFSDETTQGWVATQGLGIVDIFEAPLNSDVEAGTWSIVPSGVRAGVVPVVRLVSPIIERDSRLFDRVRMRLRMVSGRPFSAFFDVVWLNEVNAGETFPGVAPRPEAGSEYDYLAFSKARFQQYSTEWQVVGVDSLLSEDLLDVVRGRRGRQVWDGELIRFALRVFLTESVVVDPRDVPEALEIDWIQLTGVEELLQGEGEAPTVEEPVWLGELFAPAAFRPLGVGVGGAFHPLDRKGFLGDLQEDGLPDLLASWRGDDGSAGWLTARNEGDGLFVRDEIVPGQAAESLAGIAAGDLNGDGLMDLAIHDGSGIQLMYRDLDEGWVKTHYVEGMRFLWAGDADGDGVDDLWTASTSPYYVELRLSDGRGGWREVFRLGSVLEDGFAPLSLVAHLGGREYAGLLLGPVQEVPFDHRIIYLDGAGGIVQKTLHVPANSWPIRSATDLDGDGNLDLVVSKSWSGVGNIGTGLEILMNNGDGTFESRSWDDRVQLADAISWFDLNGDDMLDAVYVDPELQGRAVVVSLGQEEGIPVLEGRYPIQGAGGAVLGGDVNNNGRIDLIVLERAAQGGGVHVLLNTGDRPGITAVDEVQARPRGIALGANYPNPFNPGTVISFEVPAGAGEVRLGVYSTAGQLVRTLISGGLDGGRHEARWDGQDGVGMGVATGVYLIRLEAAGSVALGKMVKLQ